MSDHEAAHRWQERHVYVRLPRCPRCDGIDLATNGTLTKAKPEPGVVRSQSKRCRDCGHTFQVHFE